MQEWVEHVVRLTLLRSSQEASPILTVRGRWPSRLTSKTSCTFRTSFPRVVPRPFPCISWIDLNWAGNACGPKSAFHQCVPTTQRL